MREEPRLKKIIDWIRETTDVASGRGALVPVSGGTDSALCFWLCTQALPHGRTLAVYAGDNLRCKEWFERQGPIRYMPCPPNNRYIEAQRWALMLAEALAFRGWLVGTRNRTEEVFGTYSLASRVATYLPLVGLWKTEVMELSELVGVPNEILASSRRADPSCGRPQELADIPLAVIDTFLKAKVGDIPSTELTMIPNAVLAYLDSVFRRNRFKPNLPLRPPT